MSESNGKDTGNADGRNAADNAEREKSRRLVDKDRPKEAAGTRPTQDRDTEVYRPDANVDNEKEPASRQTPGHNSSPGAQASEQKRRKRHIDDASDAVDSPRRDG
ncbi:hypothetical protein [Modicisalibacter radicis]|uniref:hypothetical protein n=1 Tax=Halomonas sp. EAR18 TaxID=2518972 RepID=UPI00109D47CF|nr:hypothetical protein [Halomonas sp. EAR18]